MPWDTCRRPSPTPGPSTVPEPLAPTGRRRQAGPPGAFATRPRCISVFKEQRRLTGNYGASPILRRAADPSEALRSFGERPILRRLTDPSEALRFFGDPPILRRPTDPSESRRSFGESPILRRTSDPSDTLRFFGDLPILRRAAAPATRLLSCSPEPPWSR